MASIIKYNAKRSIVIFIIVTLPLFYWFAFTLIYSYLVIQPDNLFDYAVKLASAKFNWFKSVFLFSTSKYLKATIYTVLLALFAYSTAVVSYLLIHRNDRKLYGNAQWERPKNIIKRFHKKKGIILAKFNDSFLVQDDNKHMAIAAPSRRGKGVQIGIPNHLFWQGSLCTLDVKGEAYAITSKYRKEVLGQDVYLFNPDEPNTHRYNPLDYVRLYDPANPELDFEEDNLADIAAFFYPTDVKDAVWNQTAQSVFIGAGLLLHDLIKTQTVKLPYTISSLIKLVQGISVNDLHSRVLNTEVYRESYKWIAEKDLEKRITIKDLLELSTVAYSTDENLAWGTKDEVRDAEDDQIPVLLENKYVPYEAEDGSIIYARYSGYREKTVTRLNSLLAYKDGESSNTYNSIVMSFNAPIQFMLTPSIERATSTSDFRFEELRKKKTSVYFVVSVNRIKKLAPLVSLFFQQLVNSNLDEKPEDNPKIKEQLLLMLDEFPSIGKVTAISDSIAYVAGYGIKLLLIFQDISQLEATYGDKVAMNIMKNCSTKLYFAPNDDRDAQRLSAMLGDQTIDHSTTSHSTKAWSGTNINNSEQKRALMLPQELLEMSKQCLIIEDTMKPVKADMFAYFKEPTFIKALTPLSDTLRKHGEVKVLDNREPPFKTALANKELSYEFELVKNEVDSKASEEKAQRRARVLRTVIETESDNIPELAESMNDEEIRDVQEFAAFTQDQQEAFSSKYG